VLRNGEAALLRRHTTKYALAGRAAMGSKAQLAPEHADDRSEESRSWRLPAGVDHHSSAPAMAFETCRRFGGLERYAIHGSFGHELMILFAGQHRPAMHSCQHAVREYPRGILVNGSYGQSNSRALCAIRIETCILPRLNPPQRVFIHVGFHLPPADGH